MLPVAHVEGSFEPLQMINHFRDAGRSVGFADPWLKRCPDDVRESSGCRPLVEPVGRRQGVRISLEDVFWTALKDIAAARGVTPANLVAVIDGARSGGNLSSAIRVFVLNHYRADHQDQYRPAAAGS